MKSFNPCLILAPLSCLVLLACGQATGTKARPNAAPEVSVITLKARDLAQDFEYVGQTASSREIEVRARVGGILAKRHYEEGARVKAGSLLFELDAGNFQNQVAATQAALAVAQARLNQARRELARLTPLAAEKAISQKEFDDASSNHETLEASLRQAQAQANEAKLNLGYTRVLAPIDGITGVAAKSEGSLLTGADSLLTTIVQTDPIFIQFSISETDHLKLSQDLATGKVKLAGPRANNGSFGFAVKLKLADGSVWPLVGKMNFSSEKVNPATGGFDARAQVANPKGLLRPGQFVRVSLQGVTRTEALAIPQRAVTDGQGGKTVFTVDAGNKLQAHTVELDGWSNGEWIVSKGLQVGQRVVVDGLMKAQTPGMTVKPVALAAAPK
jgi:membrane fusion protein, multidrug efflux system